MVLHLILTHADRVAGKHKRKHPYRVCCNHCGSENVECVAATSVFDVREQQWVMADAGESDGDRCNDCNSEGSESLNYNAPYDPQAFLAWRRMTFGPDAEGLDPPRHADYCQQLIAEGSIQIGGDDDPVDTTTTTTTTTTTGDETP